MKKLLKEFDIRDLSILIGSGILFYGVFLIFQPAAYIVLGMGLIYLGVPKHGNNK